MDTTKNKNKKDRLFESTVRIIGKLDQYVCYRYTATCPCFTTNFCSIIILYMAWTTIVEFPGGRYNKTSKMTTFGTNKIIAICEA